MPAKGKDVVILDDDDEDVTPVDTPGKSSLF